MTPRKYTVVELYAGIARTWEPFRTWRRCQLGLLVDINSYANETYKLNYPSAPYLTGDLRKLSAEDLRELAGGRVDILLGCPPCQGFSDTGKRNPRDPRNGHIATFGKFVSELRPLAVVMENVPLLATSPRFVEFTQLLDRHKYHWTAAVVNAALFGSCQTRQRLVLVALHESVGADPFLPKPTHGGDRRYFSFRHGQLMRLSEDPVGLLGATPAAGRAAKSVAVITDLAGKHAAPYLSEVLDGLPAIGSRAARELSHISWFHGPKMVRRMESVAEGDRWSGGSDHFSQSYGRLHRRGLARTITSYFSNPGSGRFWHPTQPRTLTLREAARIQGIDDSFQFGAFPSKAAELVGNALDLAIAGTAYTAVRRALD
jgi:DNA (cytosine-5)-methyltransferase 1